MQDSALIGFVDPGSTDPGWPAHTSSSCSSAEFRACPEDQDRPRARRPRQRPGPPRSRQAWRPAHPTEIAGLLREAITAGVDVAGARVGATPPTTTDRPRSAHTARSNAVKRDVRRTPRSGDLGRHQPGNLSRPPSEGRLSSGPRAWTWWRSSAAIDILTGRWDTACAPPTRSRAARAPHGTTCSARSKAKGRLGRVPQHHAAVERRERAPPDRRHRSGPLVAPGAPTIRSGARPRVVDDPTMTKADGPHAAQVNRTLATAFQRNRWPDTAVRRLSTRSTGDLSVRNTWQQLTSSAERYLYIEDQYFWIERERGPHCTTGSRPTMTGSSSSCWPRRFLRHQHRRSDSLRASAVAA